MIAASGPQLENPVPLTVSPRDNCSEEEHSHEEEIPHLSAEQIAAQL